MTTNPIQPLKGNRDDNASRPGAPAASPGQTAQAVPYSTPKQGPSATSRDEGSRSFRSGGEAGSQNQSQSRDSTKQATERQSNEGGPRPSRTEDTEDAGLSSDRNRNLGNDI